MSVNGYAMVKTVHNSVYDGNCDISAAMSWTEVQFRVTFCSRNNFIGGDRIRPTGIVVQLVYC